MDSSSTNNAVLVADVAEGWRRSVVELLSSRGCGARVVVQAPQTDGDVLALARELEAEVVLLDLGGIGDAETIELCRELKVLPGPPAVVLYGEWDERASYGAGRGDDPLLAFSLADARVAGALVPTRSPGCSRRSGRAWGTPDREPQAGLGSPPRLSSRGDG